MTTTQSTDLLEQPAPPQLPESVRSVLLARDDVLMGAIESLAAGVETARASLATREKTLEALLTERRELRSVLGSVTE